LITVLARSENLVYHLAALVEASGDAIVSFTLDGTILSWNKGAQRIYGFSAEELKGQPIALLSPQDNGVEMIRVLQKIRNGERVQPFETIHQARNGRTVRAFIRISAILGSTHQAIGASFCAQELTDRPPVQTSSIEGSRIV
jgi:PAS domain S-box-containing protein